MTGVWYSVQRQMRILFAISLVALAALLWASVSIAQHIYRSRRRQRTLSTETHRRPVKSVPAKPADSGAQDEPRQRKAS